MALTGTRSPQETGRKSTGSPQKADRKEQFSAFFSLPLALLWPSLTKPDVVFRVAAPGSQSRLNARVKDSTQRVGIPVGKGLPEIPLTRL